MRYRPSNPLGFVCLVLGYATLVVGPVTSQSRCSVSSYIQWDCWNMLGGCPPVGPIPPILVVEYGCRSGFLPQTAPPDLLGKFENLLLRAGDGEFGYNPTWSQVEFVLTASPTMNLADLTNVSAALPVSLGFVYRRPPPGGTMCNVYGHSLCVPMRQSAAAGFYTIVATTFSEVNGVVGPPIGAKAGLLYIGQNGFPGPPVPDPFGLTVGAPFVITGTSDGVSYSFGFSTGPGPSLLAPPPMVTMPGLTPGFPASAFATAIVNAIGAPGPYASWGAAIGLTPDSFNVFAPVDGSPIYLWVGNGAGRPLAIVGAGGSAVFNPTVSSPRRKGKRGNLGVPGEAPRR